MTFSICVHETETDDADEAIHRFGVAVTTRLPGVGTLCPFVSENGAVATQSVVNVDLGRRGIEYVDDGLAVGDALDALLSADDGAPERQLHGVDAAGTFAYSGPDCGEWFGHLTSDGDGRSNDHYSVAGNLLAGEDVIEATATAYEGSGREAPLAERLIDALAAGQAEGGDKREELSVQSAALRVRTTAEHEATRFFDDLRVDASESPVADLRETYELAVRGSEDVREVYGENGDGDRDDGDGADSNGA